MPKHITIQLFAWIILATSCGTNEPAPPKIQQQDNDGTEESSNDATNKLSNSSATQQPCLALDKSADQAAVKCAKTKPTGQTNLAGPATSPLAVPTPVSASNTPQSSTPQPNTSTPGAGGLLGGLAGGGLLGGLGGGNLLGGVSNILGSVLSTATGLLGNVPLLGSVTGLLGGSGTGTP